MDQTYDEIMRIALTLPPGSRAMLAEHLLESLDAPDQQAIDTVWAKEAEKRLQDIKDGRVKPISGPQVLRNLRDRLA